MKVALVQLDIIWEDREANLKRAAGFVRQAADGGSDVAVLPEMFSTGFSMNARVLSEPLTGNTDSTISKMASDNGINIIAGVQVRDEQGGGCRNMALVYDRSGRLVGSYSKMHLFSPAGEDRYFKEGTEPKIFELDGIPCSVFICYDLRFPEVFRAVARDISVTFVIANWPKARAMHWNTLLRARAIEDQCYIIGVNRVGIDGNNISYNGGSAVFGPGGEAICEAGDKEEVVICDIDPAVVQKARSEFPSLKDMRT